MEPDEDEPSFFFQKSTLSPQFAFAHAGIHTDPLQGMWVGASPGEYGKAFQIREQAFLSVEINYSILNMSLSWWQL